MSKKPSEFSAWDDLLFTLGGLFVLALPIALLFLLWLVLF
jgi:hypothetical protein